MTRAKNLWIAVLPIQSLIELKRRSLFDSYLFKVRVTGVEDVVTFGWNNNAWHF